MKKQAQDWCYLTDRSMVCGRCGGTENVKIPATTTAFVMRMKAFEEDHKHCQMQVVTMEPRREDPQDTSGAATPIVPDDTPMSANRVGMPGREEETQEVVS